jgi:ring-1,2-phenylacetyl-CoA epoxidase subunit PaaE
MSTPHLHELFVKRVTPDAAGSAVITFAVPPELRDTYAFRPGQFLTLRTTIDGVAIRRSYSICSSRPRYARSQELEVGIKPLEGGTFSRWATVQLRPGDVLDVMPPEGRFSPRIPDARHRVAFCAGSGITPVLSIIASTLEEDPQARFTLVYGNQRMSSIMFNEALQDLKDKYPARLTLIHLLSRQPQEFALLNGRLDEAKVAALLDGLVPVASIDEAFICGPEGMIDATERALRAAGLGQERIHTERFFSADTVETAKKKKAVIAASGGQATPKPADFSLDVVLDGKTHHFGMAADDRVLDIALDAGLDLPYSCKGGVCCTCRARVLEGQVQMDKNFTLEQWEIDKGFVLTCQARPVTPRVVVSYDER